MAENSDKKDKPLEIPEYGEEILSLLEAYNRMNKPSAVRQLQISPQTLDAWVDALARDGWIKVTDRDLEDYYFELTEKAVLRIKELKDLKKKESQGPEAMAIKKKPEVKVAVKSMKKNVSGFVALIQNNIIDLSLVLSCFVVLWLTQAFVSNPNQRIMNFVAAIILFSVILMVYRTSKEKLKSKTLIESIEEFIMILRNHLKYVAFAMLAMLLIYFGGWLILYPEHRVVLILICTVLVTSIIQIFRPLTAGSRVLQFNSGMLILVYCLMLMSGITSLTEILIQVKNRTIDLIMAVMILGILYLNKDFFGIDVAKFKNILEQDKNR